MIRTHAAHTCLYCSYLHEIYYKRITGGSRGRARRTPPYGTKFFRFHIHFCRKAPMSEVHAPPYRKSWIRHCVFKGGSRISHWVATPDVNVKTKELGPVVETPESFVCRSATVYHSSQAFISSWFSETELLLCSVPG